MSDMPEDRRRRIDNDHDLLLNISSKLNNFIEIYGHHVKEKSAILSDHENRLRFVERAIWLGFGALALFQLILKYI